MRVLAVIIAVLALASPLSASSVYTLEGLISAMRSSNSELRKADEEIYQASLDTKDAKGQYTPTVDLLVSGTYMVNPVLGTISIDPGDIKIGDSGIAGLIPPEYSGIISSLGDITVPMDMGSNRIQGQLTLTQPIYTWGKISNAVKLYETVENIRRIEKSDREKQLTAELLSRLDALYYMDRIFPLLDELDAKADELISIAESAESEGVMISDDVLDARLQKQQIAISRRELEAEYVTVLEGLRTLTGISAIVMDDISYTPDDSFASYILSCSAEDLTEMATSSERNTMKMLSLSESISEYREKIARGSMYGKPDIALQVAASYGGTIKDSSWDDQWGVNVTLALSTTLWDGGKKLNDKNRAESETAVSSIEKDRAIRAIEENVSVSYAEAMLSKEKLEYLELSLDSDNRKLEREKTAFALGSSSKSDVLEKEIKVIQDEIEIATEHITLSSTVYSLAYMASLDPVRLPIITDGMK